MTETPRRPVRLIALDLDGTTLNTSKHIDEGNRSALRAAAEKGVTVVLASGRMTDCITPFAEELALDCMIISYNGGMARGLLADGRPELHHCPLQASYGAGLIDFCRDRYMLNYYVDDVLHAQDRPELRQYAGIYSQRTGAKYHFVPDLDPYRESDPTKAIIVCDPGERERLYDEWIERWGGETTIVKTDPEYLEFLNKDTNKGVALADMAGRLGLHIDEVMAMGDGDNDADMLATAGLGVAVANASDLARANADVLLDVDHTECAVAAAVERYILAS